MKTKLLLIGEQLINKLLNFSCWEFIILRRAFVRKTFWSVKNHRLMHRLTQTAQVWCDIGDVYIGKVRAVQCGIVQT